VTDFSPLFRFAVLFVRPGMLVMAAPTFGGAWAPTQVRIGLTLLLTFMLIPIVHVPAVASEVGLALIVLRELAIGLAIGFGVKALITGAELAGHLSGYSIGFSYGSVVDPQSGVRNNMIAALYGNLALLTFFATNAHHTLIRAMVSSYAVMPIGAGHLDGSLVGSVTEMLGLVFVLGVRLAMPLVVVLLLVELAMGLIARAAPMLNLLIAGMPVRIVVGLLVVSGVVGVAPDVISGFTQSAIEIGFRAARAFR